MELETPDCHRQRWDTVHDMRGIPVFTETFTSVHPFVSVEARL